MKQSSADYSKLDTYGLVSGSPRSEAGFTILELMVSSSLGLILMAMILGSSISTRNYFKEDLIRARANENARGVIDIIAADVRLGGENLGSAFPAIEVADSGTNDTMIIRRNMLSEVLPLCSPLAVGSNTNASFAIPGSVAGCTYSGQTTNYNAWRNYRTAKGNGQPIDAYIWNSSTRLGEFFGYIGEIDSGTSYSIIRTGVWSRAYPATSTSIYILEEWRFRRNGTNLELITNQNFAAPSIVAFGINSFDIQITTQSNTVVSSLSPTDSWTNVKLIATNLGVTERFAGQNVSRTITGYFFPRNVLSN